METKPTYEILVEVINKLIDCIEISSIETSFQEGVIRDVRKLMGDLLENKNV